jgi:RNA polymerase sigma-70 factor (ECF subfamily)
VADCEEVLLKRARRDRSAFGGLQATLDAPVRRFIQRLIGRSDAEDDIVRETFLALYINLGRLDCGQRLRPFLFRVVRNLCYSELRRLGRFQIVSLDAQPDEVHAAWLQDDQVTADEALHWSLLYGEVQTAMDRLPEAQRQTLILLCEEDFSYAQIAEAMTTDIGTVKSRIHYGRKNLRRLLRPDTLHVLGIEKEN